MDDRNTMIRQIILVTDGQSNVGGDPVVAARNAFNKNITVNTIGIINQKDQREEPFEEIVNIAQNGGGNYEYTYIDNLSQTMQSITYKTVNQTLQSIVNKQLKQIIGEDLNNMPPTERSKILNYIDSFSEEIAIQCCILLDCSGSMASKIHAARHSILDLISSFKGRKGKVELAIITFPGDTPESCEVVHHFYDDNSELERSLYKVKPKGGTPTAYAINYAAELIEQFSKNRIQNKSENELEVYIG